MTGIRLLPLPVHAALRALSGLALMVVAVAAGLSPAGLVLAVVLGAVVVGVSLKAVDGGDRPVVSPGDLRAFDAATVVALLASALALALLDGDPAGGVTFAVAAAVTAVGNALTRYSTRG